MGLWRRVILEKTAAGGLGHVGAPRRDKPRMLDTLALAPASDLQKPSLGHQLWGPQKVGMEGG